MAIKELPGRAAKQAAKKVAKKAAKKVAKKAGKKGAKSAGHHLRRGYEHLHRVRVLARSLSSEALAEVQTLSQYAQAALQASDDRVGADLLRAAEHVAFASLAQEEADASLSTTLVEALQDEYEHLVDRAAAEWDQQDPTPARALGAIYNAARKQAKLALRAGAYHRALEFARAADAIAHAAPAGLRLERGAKSQPDLLLGA